MSTLAIGHSKHKTEVITFSYNVEQLKVKADKSNTPTAQLYIKITSAMLPLSCDLQCHSNHKNVSIFEKLQLFLYKLLTHQQCIQVVLHKYSLTTIKQHLIPIAHK